MDLSRRPWLGARSGYSGGFGLHTVNNLRVMNMGGVCTEARKHVTCEFPWRMRTWHNITEVRYYARSALCNANCISFGVLKPGN